jgi:hypothetical protein
VLHIKEATRRLLRRIQMTTYYPEPPKSGLTTTITIYSSREWMDWFNHLNCAQRTQLVQDSFKRQP